MSFLVDTNVISELRKGRRCDGGVLAWWADVESTEIYLSVLTVGEIRRGIERIRRRDSSAASSLESWLYRLLNDYADRILPIDLEIADDWARLNVPDPLPVIDGLLLATARVRGLTVVTRNIRDMARAGVLLVNPFES